MLHFPKISLLITHYNRSKSLENLLVTMSNLGLKFGEIIVSDDGSEGEHLDHLVKLQSYFDMKVVRSATNKGLGHNLNKGQDAVAKEYTLYIQEDFEPTEFFSSKLKDALRFMEEDPQLDYIRFYAYCAFPYLLPFKSGFSSMYIKPFASDYGKIYCYSDHPHLRRSSFFQKFGRYQEGLKGDKTEYKMCVSFIQNKGKGLFYNDFSNLFVQKNSTSEPSTMNRQSWKQGNNLAVRLMRDAYRQVKYNYDIIMMKSYKKVD